MKIKLIYFSIMCDLNTEHQHLIFIENTLIFHSQIRGKSPKNVAAQVGGHLRLKHLAI